MKLEPFSLMIATERETCELLILQNVQCFNVLTFQLFIQKREEKKNTGKQTSLAQLSTARQARSNLTNSKA